MNGLLLGKTMPWLKNEYCFNCSITFEMLKLHNTEKYNFI